MITQTATGEISPESPAEVLNMAMQRSVETKDLTPIVIIASAFTKALVEPREFEINGYIVKVRKSDNNE